MRILCVYFDFVVGVRGAFWLWRWRASAPAPTPPDASSSSSSFVNFVGFSSLQWIFLGTFLKFFYFFSVYALLFLLLQMDREKLMKMASAVRTGGKGTVRR